MACSQAPSEPTGTSASVSAPDTRPTSLPESPDEALGLRLPVRVRIVKRTDTFAEFTLASTTREVKDFLERQLDEARVTPTPDGGYELVGRRRVGDPGPLLHWMSITTSEGFVRVLMQTRPDPARFVPPRRDEGPLEPGEFIAAEGVDEPAPPGTPDAPPQVPSEVEREEIRPY
jgi:hypothetical protein